MDNPTPTFPSFPLLPPELRHQIWALTPTPRRVSIRPARTPAGGWTLRWDVADQHRYPPALSASRESRAATLAQYPLLDVSTGGALDTLDAAPAVRFHLDKDVLHLAQGPMGDGDGEEPVPRNVLELVALRHPESGRWHSRRECGAGRHWGFWNTALTGSMLECVDLGPGAQPRHVHSSVSNVLSIRHIGWDWGVLSEGPGGTPRACHGSYADNYQFLFCLFKHWDDPGRRLETCSFWTRPALGWGAVVEGPPTTEIRMASHLSAAVVEGADLVPGDAAAVGRLLRAHGAVVVRKWRQELAPVHDHPRRVSQRAFFQIVDPGVVEDEELLRILRAIAYRPVPERFLAYTSQRGMIPGRLIDTKLFSPRLLEPEPHGICLRGFGYDI